MGLLKVVLVILLVYFILRFVARALFGYARYANQRASGNDQSQSRKREGDVEVNVSPKSGEKKISQDEGDYVNFEEVKDD